MIFFDFMSFEKFFAFCVLKNIHDFAWKNFSRFDDLELKGETFAKMTEQR